MTTWERNDHLRSRHLKRGVPGLYLLVTLPVLVQPCISRLIVPQNQTAHEQALTTMLVEETKRGTAGGAAVPVEHTPLTAVAADERVIVLADRPRIDRLLARPTLPAWCAALASQHHTLLAQHPAWLIGVFFGPPSRDSFFTQRRLIPAQYAMQFYPDIGHTMYAQFPVPQWDPIFARTEGREPMSPRPVAFATIYKYFAPLHSGFINYPEGVTDDVNKIVWTLLGWSASTRVDTIPSDYARSFLRREGPQNSDHHPSHIEVARPPKASEAAAARSRKSGSYPNSILRHRIN